MQDAFTLDPSLIWGLREGLSKYETYFSGQNDSSSIDHTQISFVYFLLTLCFFVILAIITKLLMLLDHAFGLACELGCFLCSVFAPSPRTNKRKNVRACGGFYVF